MKGLAVAELWSNSQVFATSEFCILAKCVGGMRLRNAMLPNWQSIVLRKWELTNDRFRFYTTIFGFYTLISCCCTTRMFELRSVPLMTREFSYAVTSSGSSGTIDERDSTRFSKVFFELLPMRTPQLASDPARHSSARSTRYVLSQFVTFLVNSVLKAGRPECGLLWPALPRVRVHQS